MLDAEDALCAQTDPDLFFPEDGNRWVPERAKAICYACPLTFECLEAALSITRPEDHGIWGASTPRQRQDMKYNPARKQAFVQVLKRKKFELENKR